MRVPPKFKNSFYCNTEWKRGRNTEEAFSCKPKSFPLESREIFIRKAAILQNWRGFLPKSRETLSQNQEKLFTEVCSSFSQISRAFLSEFGENFCWNALKVMYLHRKGFIPNQKKNLLCNLDSFPAKLQQYYLGEFW